METCLKESVHDGRKALDPALDHKQLKELGVFIQENRHSLEHDRTRIFIKTRIGCIT